MTLTLINSSKCHGGNVNFYKHRSEFTQTNMTFGLFLPQTKPKIVLYWLSGLTCNETNFLSKAGAQKFASENGIVLLCPDTSPRGTNIAGEHDSWDFGSGAGFYVDAVTNDWKKHYQMYSYVTVELGSLLQQLELGHLPRAISGHSMGGHGALTIGMKNKDQFRSISAFSPICNPIQAAWGQKAFSRYLGDDRNLWRSYDSCELVETTQYCHPVLVHQGLNDEFYQDQLMTEMLINKNKSLNLEIHIEEVEGYDHSYYFVASFIDKHMQFHIDQIESS